MIKKGRLRGFCFFIISILIIILLGFLVSAENSENATEWWMWGKYLNHTTWDGVDFTVVPGMNYSYFHASDYIGYSSPAIANGYVYAGSGASIFYQLNASNVSQQIANFTSIAGSTSDTPVIAYGSIYFIWGQYLYQLNASNISKQITNFTQYAFNTYDPIVANGSVYIGGYNEGVNSLYQLNASNISQQIANSTIMAKALAFANGYIYVGGGGVGTYGVYQLNASNISQQIANFTYGTDFFNIPPAVYNGSLYISNAVASPHQAYMFQLNASNVSEQFANFSLGTQFGAMSPAIANGYLYIGGGAGGSNKIVYQLNVSNVSQQIANYTPGGYALTSATIADDSVYIGASDTYMYQLNASNISNFIGKTYIGSEPYYPAYAKGYIYFGSANYNLYQVNASNLSLFPIVDLIPPSVSLTANLNVNMPGEMNLNLWLNEAGYCEYSFDGGKTNSTFGFYSPTAYLFSQGFTSLAAGTYTVNAYCNDTSGNRNDTATASFTITYSTTPSGGGETSASTTTSVPSISSGEPTTITITNPHIEVGGVVITTTENVSAVSITVKELNKSKLADFEIGISTRQIYQALNISVSGLNNSQIANATVNFRVNMSWVEDQRRATEEDVLLFRRNDVTNKWEALDTTYLGNDSQYYYYSAITPGFSTFVIFFGRYECEPGSMRCFENNIQMCLGNATWLVTEKCPYGCGEEGVCYETPFQSKVFYVILVAVVSVAIIITFYIIVTRIRKRKRR